jgi:hypothetical protein
VGASFAAVDAIGVLFVAIVIFPSLPPNIVVSCFISCLLSFRATLGEAITKAIERHRSPQSLARADTSGAAVVVAPKHPAALDVHAADNSSRAKRGLPDTQCTTTREA